MKTKESFGELMLNVWAAILRVLFPRYCVKSLILKNRKSNWRYLLGSEKELRLIDKLKLSDDELAARKWSHQTKVALIHRGCEALLSEVKTEEELDAVVAHRKSRLLVKAMRSYTPSLLKMRELCASLDEVTLIALATEVPWVFDSLEPWEIFNVKEGEVISSKHVRWQIALKLAKVRPVWSLTFLKALRAIVPNRLEEEGHKLISEFFNIAYDAKVDISEMMPYLSVFFPDLYTKVRENHDKYEEFSSFFVMIFPQLLKFLKKEIISSIDDISISGVQQPDQDAYAWLRIGCECLRDKKIYNCILNNLGQIKAVVLPFLFKQLLVRLVFHAEDFYDLLKLYPVSGDLQGRVQRLLVEKAERGNTVCSFSSLYPFADWDQEYAKRIIAVMVKTNIFPSMRLNELSSELREVALQEMEKKSQIDAIKNYERISELIYSASLYPEAEKSFLALRHPQQSYDALKQEYVQKVCMKEATIQWLLTGAFFVLQGFEIEKFLYLHAKQWGISQEQYCMLVQGKLSHIAPFLLKYVKAENGSDANAI